MNFHLYHNRKIKTNNNYIYKLYYLVGCNYHNLTKNNWSNFTFHE